MRKIMVLALCIAMLLTGCAASSPTPTPDVSDKDLLTATPSTYEEAEQETGEVLSEAEQALPEDGRFDIRFVYHNGFYGYDLEATWSDVPIKKTATNLHAEIHGLELLFDGHVQMFDELDMDASGSLDANEWIDLESSFPLKDYDADENGTIEAMEFTGFSQKLGGFDAEPTGFTITQPTMEGYALELDEVESPVSLKILRASSIGFTGAYNSFFPAGTTFVELAADYTIFVPAAGDMVVTSAFDYPLLNMYIEDTKEVTDSYSHGAMGFSSVVDTDAFNGIFSGKPFSLQYEAYYEGKVVGTYDLTITPR